MPSIASRMDGTGLLIEFEQQDAGDVNRSFYEMTPGTIHCIDGAGFGIPDPHSYYIEVGAADTLTLERLDAPCAKVAQASRAFTANAIQLVR
jgi:hypothetical protein